MALGQAVTPGWADFEITLESYLPHAQLQRKIIPTDDKQVQGAPALHLALSKIKNTICRVDCSHFFLTCHDCLEAYGKCEDRQL